ncbi:uridine diphosphate glucose pyrophosphatase NUDT22 isoform X2 [Gopherus evgoodei]|uniref:uridine diphosphate glucose pyrophosphatase NUDT22 isoform X2 n=1 Tax=Gopherus evgoodei TaxID=1825980 RepID=UPI0011CF1505|nr:uridine diphosphate glucose pyrophosphatase NUDT22 isoform X2 [Gopherus evgoodei]
MGRHSQQGPGTTQPDTGATGRHSRQGPGTTQTDTRATERHSWQGARAAQPLTGATGGYSWQGPGITHSDTEATERHSWQGARALLNQSARPQAAADFREEGGWGRAVELELEAVVGDVPEESIRLQDLPRQMVVKEIFTSILREIRDEVNLPLPTLSQPVLLGIARNQTSAGRASAEFYVRCSLTSEQVKQRYEIGGPEAQESTSIIFIKREDVLTLEQTGEMWRELCPSAKGAVRLYTLVQGGGQ